MTSSEWHWRSKFFDYSLASVADAKSIVELRLQVPTGNLKPISGSLEDQVNYMRRAQEAFSAGSEAYLRATRIRDGGLGGFFRLTELDSERHFNWASLVTTPECAAHERLDIIASAFSIGFSRPEVGWCGPFPVPKTNARVVSLHTQMGFALVDHATTSSRDDSCIYFVVGRERFEDAAARWGRRGVGLTRAMV